MTYDPARPFDDTGAVAPVPPSGGRLAFLTALPAAPVAIGSLGLIAILELFDSWSTSALAVAAAYVVFKGRR